MALMIRMHRAEPALQGAVPANRRGDLDLLVHRALVRGNR